MTTREHGDEATGIEDEPEVIIAETMARRERSEDTSPDAETVDVMARPIDRLYSQAVVLCDLSRVRDEGRKLKPRTLRHMAFDMLYQADTLYRLYHGRKPRYE